MPSGRDIAFEQSQDEECLRIIHHLDANGQLEMISGVAYKKVTFGKSTGLQMIVPEPLIIDVIKTVHAEQLGHPGWKATWIAVKRSYSIQVKNLAQLVQKLFPNAKFASSRMQSLSSLMTVTLCGRAHGSRSLPTFFNYPPPLMDYRT